MAAVSPFVHKNQPMSLAESFNRIRQNIGKGWLNDIRIQREVIVYIADECGSNLDEYVDSNNHKYSLNHILESARQKYVPLVTVKTTRRWFIFFIEHRVTMAEQRNDIFAKRRRTARSNNKSKRLYWCQRDIDALKW